MGWKIILDAMCFMLANQEPVASHADSICVHNCDSEPIRTFEGRPASMGRTVNV